MPYNPAKHHRRSIRLKGYDYSQTGLYFITLCCQDRICRFGEIENGKIVLNDAGEIVKNEWLKLTGRFSNIKLHEFIVMPNHLHAILEIVAQNNTGTTVGDIVGAFVSITTVEYIRGVKNSGWEPFDKKIWQRNYHEHIIRNEQSCIKISEYIINNPANWDNDSLRII